MSLFSKLSRFELALIALILAGGAYLASERFAGHSAQPSFADAAAPVPAFRYFEREDGMPVAELDPRALADFLRSRGLPPLRLPWPPIEAAVARRFEAAFHALARTPTADAHGRVGQLFDALGMNAQARAAYDHAVRLAPDSHRWRHYLAQALTIDNDLSGAEAEFRRAIELQPAYLPTRWRLASLCAQMGRLDEASSILRATLAGSTDSYPWTELAILELQRGNPQEARSLLVEALKRDGHAARAHAVMSQALGALGDSAGAEQHARRGRYSIKSLDPIPDPLLQERLAETDSVSYHRIAARSRMSASPAEAVVTWERICQADPTNADDKIRLANAYFEAGRPDDAVATLDVAMAQVPLGARFRLSRAQLALRMNDARTALRYADEAIALDDRVPTVHGIRSIALQALGRHTEALAAAERMCALAPDQANSFVFLAEILTRLGRFEDARAAYQQALELEPDSDAPRQGLAELDATLPR